MSTVPEIVFVIPEVPQINFLIDLQVESLYSKWLQLGLGTGDYTDFLNWLRIKGDIGASCEFQVSATHIQWRVVGDTDWIDLIALSEFKGGKGDDGHTPYVPEGSTTWWINGVDTGKQAIGQDGEPLLYEDLTPEQIAELQQPALDAAATANAAAGRADEAAGQVSDVIVIAEQVITEAEQATENANTAAVQLVDGAEADYNTLKKLQDKLKAVEAIIGDAAGDDDNLINTVRELLAVFSTFPEGSDMATLLTAKVNVADIYNALDCIIEGKVLDARQGNALNDAITALTATVGNKLSKPTTTQSTLADNDTFLLRKVDGTVIEILKTDLYAFLDDYFAKVHPEINILAAQAGAASYALTRNKQTVITGTLPNGVNSTLTLPAPTSSDENESVVHFKSNGTAAPTFVYSGFTPLWLNNISLSIKINKNYTIVFEQIYTGSAWIVKASWGEY